MLVEVTRETFAPEVLEERVPVLVDFWGPACRPCLALMPVVEKIAASHAGSLKVVKVNAAQNRRLCVDLKVLTLPTFLVFKGGQEVARLTGEVTPAELGRLAEKWGGAKGGEDRGS